MQVRSSVLNYGPYTIEPAAHLIDQCGGELLKVEVVEVGSMKYYVIVYTSSYRLAFLNEMS